MKCMLIATCDICGFRGMLDLDTHSNKNGDHYPFWYAKVGLGFEEKNRQTMCHVCAGRYDAMIKAQEEARINFK